MNTKLIYSYLEMKEENISQEVRLKNIKWVTSYFIEETNQNELTSKKHKKVFRVPNFIEKLQKNFWSEENFVIKKVENFLESFLCDELYVKWKGYDN